jgi:hypothetical protein
MKKRTKMTKRKLKKQAIIVRKRYKGQPASIASTLKEIMAHQHKEVVTHKECMTALDAAKKEE